MKFYLKFLWLGFFLASCQSTLVPISRRPLDSFRDHSKFISKSRSIEQEVDQGKEEIFLRNQEVKIVAIEDSEESASLFQVDNPQSYLFYEKPRGDIGDVLSVFVRSSLSPTEGAAPGAGPAEGENAQVGAELTAEQLEAELLAALPALTPGEDKPPIMTKIPFKVMRKLPDGDVIVEYYRSSKNDSESSAVKIQARLPRQVLQGNKPLLTSDLKDVFWYQNRNTQLTERQSLGWEDEYTLRLSGFEEARSQEALQLESKRKELVNLRDRLRQRIVTLGQERQLVVKERDRIGQLQTEIDQKIGSLEGDVRTKEGKIQEQTEIIRRQEELIQQLQGAGQTAPEPRGGADE